MCDAFLSVVRKQNRILEYTAQNPKNTTEKLNVTSELMQLSWTSLVNHINNSDDSVNLKDISLILFSPFHSSSNQQISGVVKTSLYNFLFL